MNQIQFVFSPQEYTWTSTTQKRKKNLLRGVFVLVFVPLFERLPDLCLSAVNSIPFRQ